MVEDVRVGAADDVARLLARDEDAWRSLHDREFPLLYRFARGMGADPALAEDCASEAFLRLVRQLPRGRFTSAGGIRSWLIVVCRNYLRDEFRKRRPGPAPIDELDAAALESDPLTRVALAAALGALPNAQREVVVMRFMLDLSTREVAAAVGRGEKAVESLQHRALEALRRSRALAKDLA